MKFMKMPRDFRMLQIGGKGRWMKGWEIRMRVALDRIRVFILLARGEKANKGGERASSCHREAQLEVGWKRWKGKSSRMRGGGRCNRECMYGVGTQPVSLEGRTKTSTSPRAAAPAQHSTNFGSLEQARVDRRPGGIPGGAKPSASGMRGAADWLQSCLG